MAEPTVAAAAAGVFVIVGCAAVLVWGLLRAAVMPHPMAIVIALSILTLVAIIAALVDEASDRFITLAATGIGAIAGAVTSSFNSGKDRDGEQ